MYSVLAKALKEPNELMIKHKLNTIKQIQEQFMTLLMLQYSRVIWETY